MINQVALSRHVLEKSLYIAKYWNLLKKLESLGTSITLMPDFNEKKVGFPAGLVLKNSSYIFPSSVPDIGDGYRIILTNVKAEELNYEMRLKILNALHERGSINSPIRISLTSKLDMKEVFHSGNHYIADLTEDPELTNDRNWQARTDDFLNTNQVRIPSEDIRRYRDSFGVFGSPFLELRSIQHLKKNRATRKLGLFENQVIIIIHVGTLIGKKILREHFLEPAVNFTVSSLRLPESDILSGIFVLPVKQKIGREFLTYATMLTNYSKANRSFVYVQIKRIMKQIIGDSFACSILSDIPHSKYEVKNGFVVSARGVQKIYPSGSSMASHPAFGDVSIVGGGTFGNSLLVMSGSKGVNVDYNCAHGSGIFFSDEVDPPESYNPFEVLTHHRESQKQAYADLLNSNLSFESLISSEVIKKIAELRPLINFWEEE